MMTDVRGPPRRGPLSLARPLARVGRTIRRARAGVPSVGHCRAWVEPSGPRRCATRARARCAGVGRVARSRVAPCLVGRAVDSSFLFLVNWQRFIQFGFELIFIKL